MDNSYAHIMYIHYGIRNTFQKFNKLYITYSIHSKWISHDSTTCIIVQLMTHLIPFVKYLFPWFLDPLSVLLQVYYRLHKLIWLMCIFITNFLKKLSPQYTLLFLIAYDFFLLKYIMIILTGLRVFIKIIIYHCNKIITFYNYCRW